MVLIDGCDAIVTRKSERQDVMGSDPFFYGGHDNTFMIKGCLFDLDGTLLYTLDSMASAANQMLRELELPELPLFVVPVPEFPALLAIPSR